MKQLDSGKEKSNNQAMQLFLLGNISLMADFYGNLYHKPRNVLDKIAEFRKPYCVHLLPKVFVYFEKFLNDYSKTFFEGKEDKENDQDRLYKMGSFLCTLRIIKYNLSALESF